MLMGPNAKGVLKAWSVILMATTIQLLATLLVGVKGWGLEIHSWEWIFGCGFFASLFARILLTVDDTPVLCTCARCTPPTPEEL
jgi:hypothetical protein